MFIFILHQLAMATATPTGEGEEALLAADTGRPADAQKRMKKLQNISSFMAPILTSASLCCCCCCCCFCCCCG